MYRILGPSSWEASPVVTMNRGFSFLCYVICICSLEHSYMINNVSWLYPLHNNYPPPTFQSSTISPLPTSFPLLIIDFSMYLFIPLGLISAADVYVGEQVWGSPWCGVILKSSQWIYWSLSSHQLHLSEECGSQFPNGAGSKPFWPFAVIYQLHIPEQFEGVCLSTYLTRIYGQLQSIYLNELSQFPPN